MSATRSVSQSVRHPVSNSHSLSATRSVNQSISQPRVVKGCGGLDASRQSDRMDVPECVHAGLPSRRVLVSQGHWAPASPSVCRVGQSVSRMWAWRCMGLYRRKGSVGWCRVCSVGSVCHRAMAPQCHFAVVQPRRRVARAPAARALQRFQL